MDSVWFSVEEDLEYDVSAVIDGKSPFMGVFNQRPEEIAKWLPRPQTPFYQQSRFVIPISNKIFSSSTNVQRANSQPETIAPLTSISRASVSAVSVF